ncbi:MAG TPA: SUF system NifU family Fe-S cluster assembly protein [Kofleriaceae bacterium]|nr:SUF system NifU family Fe-S cluster assembly protein [Kofleriaceae bacterium]
MTDDPRDATRGGVNPPALPAEPPAGGKIGPLSIDELYQATIVDHDRAPRNAGALADPTHQATLDNPLCGDTVTLHVRIEDGVIRDIAFDARGCALSRAAASIMTTLVRGRTIDASRDLAAAFERFVQAAPDAAVDEPDGCEVLGELRAFAGVRRFRSRRVCALLGFRALLRALDPAT